MKTKRCTKCGVLKGVDAFYRDKSTKDGYQGVCVSCRKSQAKVNEISITENGYTRTPDQREKMSDAHKGHIPWNKGTGGCKRGHDPRFYVQMPNGVHLCLKCARENNAKWRKANRKRHLIMSRVARYGITVNDLNLLWETQRGVCAICGEILDGKKYRIDHDHITGKVRGILCTSCNTGVGLLKDSPEVLINAARYLENARK